MNRTLFTRFAFALFFPDVTGAVRRRRLGSKTRRATPMRIVHRLGRVVCYAALFHLVCSSVASGAILYFPLVVTNPDGQPIGYVDSFTLDSSFAPIYTTIAIGYVPADDPFSPVIPNTAPQPMTFNVVSGGVLPQIAIIGHGSMVNLSGTGSMGVENFLYDDSHLTFDGGVAPAKITAFDQSVVTVNNGDLSDIYGAGHSHITVTAGSPGFVTAIENAAAMITGGTITGLGAHDSGTVSMTGGTNRLGVAADGQSSVTISGVASNGNAVSLGASTVAVTNGSIKGFASANDDSSMTLNNVSIGGQVLAYDASKVSLTGCTVDPAQLVEANEGSLTLTDTTMGDLTVRNNASATLQNGRVINITRVQDASFTASGTSFNYLQASGGSVATLDSASAHAVDADDDSKFTLTGASNLDFNANAHEHAIMTISSGHVGGGVGAFDNSIVTIDGGAIDNGLSAAGSSPILVMNGGTVSGGVTGIGGNILLKGGQVNGDAESDFDLDLDLSGATINGAAGAFGNSILTMSAGSTAGSLTAHDTSHVLLTGGTVGANLQAFDQSVITMTGGFVTGFGVATDSATINWEGGLFGHAFPAAEFAAVESDEPTALAYAEASDPIDTSLLGLTASGGGTIRIYGFDLQTVLVDPDFDGMYSEYQMVGRLADGTVIDGAYLFIENNSLARYELLPPVPEPDGLVLAGLGLLGLAALSRRRTPTRHRKERTWPTLGLTGGMTCRRVATLAALLIVTVVGTTAHAAWTVTILNPAGATDSLASGISGTEQVGSASFDDGLTFHAGLWSGTAESWMDLNPAGASQSFATGVYGTQQVGYADGHAGLWSGTAGSFVDLNPGGATASSAWGISNTRQAGSATLSGASHAGTWSGTADSWVDLNPTGAEGSYAWGISAAQVVGSVLVNTQSTEPRVDAALWDGDANSWVDLTPGTNIGEYDGGSAAVATDGTHQVGYHEGHASLWIGTAASLVDLHPAAANGSEALGVFETLQVGLADFGHYDYSTDTYFPDTHASLWNGTADSWEDLSLALPGSWQNTRATGIWSDGATLYITGYGNSLTDGREEAILWSRSLGVPEPDGLILAGLGLLGLVSLRWRRSQTRRRKKRSSPKLSLTGGMTCRRVATLTALLIVTVVGTTAHAAWTAWNFNPGPYQEVSRSVVRGGAGPQVVEQAFVIGQFSNQYHAVLLSGGSPPNGGYSVIDLNPTGATSSDTIGTTGTQQVGQATFGSATHAGLWSGTAASWVDLNPAGATNSYVNGFTSSQEVGDAVFGSATHAGLWNGAAASWIDLNPPGATGSNAFGTDGTQQVGYATLNNTNHASLWNGGAASWVDLNPTGATESIARFIAGTQEVGSARFGGHDHAGLWGGSAASWVDLNPAGATTSQVNGIFGTEQVGQASFGSATHAGLWNGTAGTWVDLNPAGATSSVALAMFGTTEVGYAILNDGRTSPGVWHGTAESWEPLPFPYYPEENGGWAQYAHSEASNIWTDGNYLYAAGYVTRYHYVSTVQDANAMVWWSPISTDLPGDGNGDGWVDGLDYLIWAGAFGTHPRPDGDISDGDYNDDGWVDGLDYLEWASNFGNDAATVVPEPTTAVLAVAGLFVCFLRHRRS